MTAEAVVLNKSAVALAADSAVTISSGRSGIKTYETINKLFELVRGSNIGLMIYANAELNGVPWESVVKSYRKERAEFRAPYVEDYVDDFTKYLSDSTGLLSAEGDRATIIDSTYNILLAVFQYIVERQGDWIAVQSGRVITSRLKASLREALDLVEEILADTEDAPWASELSDTRIRAEFGSDILDLVDELFGRFNLGRAERSRLTDLAIRGLRACISEPGETGLVVAGFGERDYFPKLYSSYVRGRVSGVLRVAHSDVKEVSLAQPGHFSTFAQDEQARGFLAGITSEVRSAIVRYWGDWSHNELAAVAKTELTKKFPRMSAATTGKVVDEFERIAKENFQTFLDQMAQREQDLYITPMLQSIAMLPKDELGLLAESLVNITSLKQRMSIFDSQTVGGPIDVALISLGDGFVWLRRKHYFSSELNPAWHLAHHVGVQSNLTNTDLTSEGDE